MGDYGSLMKRVITRSGGGSIGSPRPRSASVTMVRPPDFAKFGPTMEELNKLEFVEMQNIEDDLRDFHIKRRKLVFSITSINTSKSKKSIKQTVSKMGFGGES